LNVHCAPTLEVNAQNATKGYKQSITDPARAQDPPAGRVTSAAEPCGGGLGRDVVDPEPGAGFGAGEVFQLAGSTTDGEYVSAEMPR
jgi:hypothetical protein